MMFLSALARRGFATTSLNCINNVAVVGGGLMGSGIAQVAATSGQQVTIIDVDKDILKQSENIIKKSLNRVIKKKYADNQEEGSRYLNETMERISTSTDVASSVKNVELVIEAIIENLALKQQLFKVADAAAPPETLFASNTSSLPIREIAKATNRQDRFGGVHFFNPVPMMKLVEVVRTTETTTSTFEKLLAWAKSLGKTTVSCQDTPGFLVNRLLVPYLMEAVRLHERGHGSKEDIDVAMKLGAGYPMGPFELLDYVGLDTCMYIMEGWHQLEPNNPLFEPSKLLCELVQSGKLGRKSGGGFYDYSK